MHLEKQHQLLFYFLLSVVLYKLDIISLENTASERHWLYRLTALFLVSVALRGING